jgi:hypothetical protein
VPGSTQDGLLQSARGKASFHVSYPCYLPNSQVLRSSSVVGDPGKQLAELAWEGPFDLSIRQAQFPPPPVADQIGASRQTIDLFPNTKATFIQINDGSSKAHYHLLWERDGLNYELQAVGPPLQQAIILRIARSLE